MKLVQRLAVALVATVFGVGLAGCNSQTSSPVPGTATARFAQEIDGIQSLYVENGTNVTFDGFAGNSDCIADLGLGLPDPSSHCLSLNNDLSSQLFDLCSGVWMFNSITVWADDDCGASEAEVPTTQPFADKLADCTQHNDGDFLANDEPNTVELDCIHTTNGGTDFHLNY